MSSDSEHIARQQGQLLTDATSKIINELDRKYFRKMQADMHRCSVKCCENDSYSLEEVQNCVKNCSVPLMRVENEVQREMQNAQIRLNRCMSECKDASEDRMGPNPSDAKLLKYSKEFESCLQKCVSKHIDIHLPAMSAKLHESLSSKK